MGTPTPQQQAAIEKRGNFILTAIPGSGKTFAVAKRIADIIETESLEEHQGVLALSFTNNASNEINKTFYETTKKNLGHPNHVSTIDSFLHNFIFMPFGHTVLGNSSKKPELLTSNEFLINLYQSFKRKKYRPLEVSYNLDGSLTHNSLGVEEYMKNMMFRNNLVSFSDINYFSLKILQNPKISQLIISRFPYIMIDEAQDCSDIQMAMIDTLVEAGHTNIVLIGDPFQSIYEWRVAKPQLFIDKSNTWETLKLSKSLRSGESICNFLRKFHPDNSIDLEPNDRTLNSQLYIVSTNGEENYPAAVKLFKKLCSDTNIQIDKNSAAVLCGSNQLVSIFSGNRDKDSTYLWKTANNHIISLPLKAKILFDKKKYLDAFNLLKRFFVFQKNSHFDSSDEEELCSVTEKIIIWECLAQLPSLTSNLDQWILDTNSLLENYCEKLGFAISTLLEKKVRFRPNEEVDGHLINIFIVNNLDLHQETRDINVETIHKSKGKTYEAVLIPVSQAHQAKICVSKIRSALNDKELINTTSSEDKRCFYVASSRPRKLLFILVPNDESLDLFDEGTKITTDRLLSLTSS